MTHAFVRAIGAVCLAASAVGAQAAAYNTNLIVNGGAEQGLAGWSTDADTPLFWAVDYGPNWVQTSQPGPADRGTALFVGGSGLDVAAGWQVADLSANSAAIATGQVSYALSGWIGGWTNQGDNALLYVRFLDAGGQLLGSSSLGPVTPADRNNSTGLFFQQAAGSLPVGTAQVRFDLSMQRLVSGDNDGYADNLAFSISAVPEPQTYALMLAGLAGVAAAARRRRG